MIIAQANPGFLDSELNVIGFHGISAPGLRLSPELLRCFHPFLGTHQRSFLLWSSILTTLDFPTLQVVVMMTDNRLIRDGIPILPQVFEPWQCKVAGNHPASSQSSHDTF